MKKLSVKDVITIAILGVLMIAVQFVVGGILGFNMFAALIVAPMLICFINGILFMLLAARVNKRGVFFIYVIMVGLAYALMGYLFVTFYFVLIGLLAELLLMRGKGAYSKPGRVSALWTVYSGLFIGSSVIPVHFMWESYSASALSGGFDMEYLNAVQKYFSEPLWLLLIAGLAVIGGFLGSLLGRRLMKKHFEKAGVV
jgi:energy-coupling factor transport system substrate-specific component